MPLAQYCERTGAGFWAEPVNALTNIAFLAAAAWMARQLATQPGGAGRWWDLWLLVVLTAVVGAGSFLWHTLRTPWTQWADIIPILLFINVFLASFLVRVAAAGVLATLVALLAFNAINIGLQMALPAQLLNGSVFYVPTWLALAGIGAYTFGRNRRSGRLLWLATGIFALSLALRTLDRPLCAATGLGTHFGWHLLNGGLLYTVTRALWVFGRRQAGAQPG